MSGVPFRNSGPRVPEKFLPYGQKWPGSPKACPAYGCFYNATSFFPLGYKRTALIFALLAIIGPAHDRNSGPRVPEPRSGSGAQEQWPLAGEWPWQCPACRKALSETFKFYLNLSVQWHFCLGCPFSLMWTSNFSCCIY